MAVTVITKKRGRPLVTGEVGVSIINWKGRHTGGGGGVSTNQKYDRKHNDTADTTCRWARAVKQTPANASNRKFLKTLPSNVNCQLRITRNHRTS